MIDSIQQFDSVPEILKALLQNKKKMSIRQLSRSLGYSSDRTVGMVMQGHREMGPEMLRRLSEFAKLSARDKEYLSLLTEKQKKQRLGQATAELELRLKEHKQSVVRTRKVAPIQLAQLVPWYSYTLIEIVSSVDQPLDAEGIHQRLRGQVSLSEIEKTLSALVELNFIKKLEGGFFRGLAENEYVETPPDVPSVTVRAIHRAQLARAADTLEEQSVDERELIAKTLTVSAERIPFIKKRIREMMEELAGQFMAPEAADSVVAQFNFQFYQQSHKKK